MVDIIIFPSSYFSIKRVDEELQNEYDAVLATGLFNVILFGYDEFISEGKLILNKIPSGKCTAVMRGWMMKPEQYRIFYDKLLKNNIQLITSPEEYELMHIFPNVYKYFGADTAEIKLYPLHERINVEELKQNFDRFMIKDFVKSEKGTEFPRYFDASVTQEQFDECMKIFYKYRGDLLTGGICVKEYLDLKLYNGKTNEYRVFYANNKILTVSKNSGQENNTDELPWSLIEKYKNLPSCYYTIDYAELADGTWSVIEAGDGSVSGLSDNQDAEQYFRALHDALKTE